MSLLNLESLQVSIGPVQAVRDVSLSLQEGECRALVGESGCGKSVTAMSLLGLLPNAAQITASQWQFSGRDMTQLNEREWRQLRGNRIAMIFQNPMTALDPTQTIGSQIAEPLLVHKGLSRREAKMRAIALLERLAIANPAQRAAQYPFEFSGGMLQRAMIAMAVVCEPELLIADEPTTALDVTVQSEVLSLLQEMRESSGTAMLFITHDLGVVAEIADSVSVMYAGQTVESGNLQQVFSTQAHPYTQALKRAVPSLDNPQPLEAIAGSPPDLRQPPTGCGFAARCAQRMAICEEAPPLIQCAESHLARCWLWHKDHPSRWRESDSEQMPMTEGSK
ncbi:Oligopeptide transport ATP-binding protein OppD [Zhongshania aliphaticivorans]|uniref:ABC-type dipeptide transporter n=1 Tax=Zhongshania aliphaticivorans TaxID=1470434 RepID=A0A5S9QEA6_9GAMM|nr:ABC transporter ATP-binding protein [Zhongshania aliphaticivorans]CAA0088087.1 Oligopeptide transport ATP-binding protein OppD [Zhongshania aliphaticivorans]CAA0115931.1 Oligopeptide transport ATP-binding protein OppD [Zhongshania aliphaticivorans]CAA0120345.1 Oligopeptide transport ATP-binding protein OppD [Zhongshania aliphaticivorans]